MKFDFDKIIDRRNTKSAKWSNPELLPLWVADMDFESPPEVEQAIRERAIHNLYGYDTPPDGYFETVQDWLKRHQSFHVDKEWLVTTSGVVEALHLAIHALTMPGDAVLIQPPVYHPFARCILHSGRQLATSPLRRIDGGYTLDLDDLDAKMADPFVKMFILCNPHNPVGKVYTIEDLSAIGEIALKHRVVVVSDEIHGDLIMKGHKHIPFAAINERFAHNSITCTAPSKTFNLAGLRTSNIFIPNPDLRDRFTRFSQSLGLHGGTLYGFIAAKAAYQNGEQWLDELLVYIESNADFVDSYLRANIPQVHADSLQGTYLQWLDFRELRLSNTELESFLRNKAGLWLSQGYTFGSEGSGFIRINLATQRSTLLLALDQLAKAVSLNSG